MDAATGNKIVFFREANALNEIVEQIIVDLPIVNKACGTAFFAVFETFFQFVDKICIHIIICFQLGIAGDLDDVGEEAIEPEGGEEDGEIIANDVLEQNNIGSALFGRDDDKTGQYLCRYFDKGIALRHGLGYFTEDAGQVDRLVSQEWHLRDRLYHERDDLCADLLLEIAGDEIFLGF